MSLPVSTEPPNVNAAMVPLTAAVAILAGQAIAIDPTTGNAVVHDILSFPNFPCIGLSVNSAKSGQVVYVQVMGVITVPRNGGGAIAVGDFIFSTGGLLVDAGANGGGASLVGICLAQTSTTTTVLVTPRANIAGVIASPNVSLDTPGAVINTEPAGTLNLFDSTGNSVSLSGATDPVIQIENSAATAIINLLSTGEIDIFATVLKLNGTPIGGALPNFADSETPATFNTNSDYDLLHTPNPLLSLQVFINDEATPKPGCDRLLVQGIDYSLTTGAHGPNTRIHYLATPTATNTIRAWYRY